MESANLHHHHSHHLQEQLSIGSPSPPPPLSTPTFTTTPSIINGGHLGSSSLTWNHNLSLNASHNYYDPSCNEVIFSNPSGLGFHDNWSNNASHSTTTINTTTHDPRQDVGSIKQELPISSLSNNSKCYPKFMDMLTSSQSSNIDDSAHDHQEEDLVSTHDLTAEKLLLIKTISSGFPINNNVVNGHQHQFSHGGTHYSPSLFGRTSGGVPSRGNFSQIYPSINISSLSHSSSPSPSSTNINSGGVFDMKFQSLDLLASTRFSGNDNNFLQPSLYGNLSMFRANHPLGFDHSVQQLIRRPSSSSSPSKTSTNETTETKRANSLIEPKPTQSHVASSSKKSRVESRASCPPLKVRKEKLGDRIAALQQLVAPFGKTDTASVLMEAIGYIKFLQSQVETLSVPYMKQSRNKISGTTMHAEGGSEESKKDLRSRGLCLVPLSCMSYMTSDAGGCGGIWPTPGFGSGT